MISDNYCYQENKKHQADNQREAYVLARAKDQI